jgi:hypothetical protein
MLIFLTQCFIASVVARPTLVFKPRGWPGIKRFERRNLYRCSVDSNPLGQRLKKQPRKAGERIKRSASGTQTYQQNGSTEAANATEVRPDFLNISVAEAEVFVNLVL